VLEPIFEADLEPSAYGYRPKRSAQDAIRKVHKLLCEGYTDLVDADLFKYLTAPGGSETPLLRKGKGGPMQRQNQRASRWPASKGLPRPRANHRRRRRIPRSTGRRGPRRTALQVSPEATEAGA
jgi:hypothetical protein